MGSGMDSTVLNSDRSYRKSIEMALKMLSDGLKKVTGSLNKLSNSQFKIFAQELEFISGFLETLQQEKDFLPDHHLNDVLRNTARSVYKITGNLMQLNKDVFIGIESDPVSGAMAFIASAYRLLNPMITITNNEMTAYVRIEKEEAPFFNPDKIVKSLSQYGVVTGILKNRIADIFNKQLFDCQIRVAEGFPPQISQDCKIVYIFDHALLDQSGGRISLKDINFYMYMANGAEIAHKILPVPGKPGVTVTNKCIPVHPPRDAEFPEMENAKLSEDQTRLLSTIDGCLSIKGGKFVLEPCRRIQQSISTETGNVEEKLLILIEKDILSNFSVRTDRDICVFGVVEGARIEAKSDIKIWGGILGKEKAAVNSYRNIHAKYISNATVNSSGDIIVEKDITHSQVYAGGNIIVQDMEGSIIGGELFANGDVIAHVIGSEIEVTTKVTLANLSKKFRQMIEENQIKLGEQEEIIEKCLQIIETIEHLLAKSKRNQQELLDHRKKTQLIMAEASKKTKILSVEFDYLQAQYEICGKRRRSIRARKTILPGTILSIEGVENEVKKETGPCMVVKQGEILAFLPFEELYGA